VTRPSAAKILRLMREEAGLTRAALAKRSGWSAQQIGHVENDRGQPSWALMADCAEACGGWVGYSRPPMPEREPPRRGHYVLTVREVRRARTMRRKGVTYQGIADVMGRPVSTIRSAVVGETWASVPGEVR